MTQACELAGVSRLRYHDLRHSAVPKMLENELIATALPSTMADEREADFAGTSHQVPHQAANVN